MSGYTYVNFIRIYSSSLSILTNNKKFTFPVQPGIWNLFKDSSKYVFLHEHQKFPYNYGLHSYLTLGETNRVVITENLTSNMTNFLAITHGYHRTTIPDKINVEFEKDKSYELYGSFKNNAFRSSSYLNKYFVFSENK